MYSFSIKLFFFDLWVVFRERNLLEKKLLIHDAAADIGSLLSPLIFYVTGVGFFFVKNIFRRNFIEVRNFVTTGFMKYKTSKAQALGF